ncbi:MAG: hypothetical protein H0W50_09565 [Parachlamydiaceae bacterium]|nr:hypothetical protein [Parachlamydiaceae bacterium]
MRLVRSIITLGALVACQLPQLAASVPYFNEPPAFNAHFFGGFREDFLKFHIGGEQPQSKNFSKVEFKGLKIAQLGASVDYSTCHHYYMRAKGDYGRIYNGKGTVRNKFLVHQLCRQDHRLDNVASCDMNEPQEYIQSKARKVRKKAHGSYHNHNHHEDQYHNHYSHNHGHHKDYNNDGNRLHFHKLHEESKQEGDVRSGHVGDVSGGFGYKVISNGGRAWIAGILGYSYETQSVELKNLRQKKDSLNVMGDSESLNGLRGRYSARWVGPWVGIDFSTIVECNVTVFGSAEWHISDYRGKGSWRMGDAYNASFKHHTRGYGAVGTLGFDWAPIDQWGFGVLATYEQWSTRKGQNRSRINNQLPGESFLPFSFPVAKKTPLRRVKRVSYSISAQTSYRF